MVHGAWAEGRRAAEWAAGRKHKSVLVIGAGYAGIAAARRLTELGLRATVIEARGRIGGRVWSRPMGGTMIESGANWLQQGDANPLKACAELAGFALCPTDFRAPLDLGPDHAIRAIGMQGLSEAMAHSLAHTAPDRTLSEWRNDWSASAGAPPDEAMRRIITAEIELESGIPLEEMTVRSVLEPGVGEGDTWLPAGLSALLANQSHGMDIRLNCPVDRLGFGQDGVTAAGSWGTSAADAAIVTVPVAVLKSGQIRFDPPLPARHRTALNGLSAGRVEKVSLMFDRRFWPRASSGYLRIHGAQPEHVSEWLDMTDHVGAPVLTGIFAGAWAGAVWQGSDTEIAERIARIVIAQARP